MKKIILLALIALMMVGCYRAKAYHDKQIELVSDYRLSTIEYQGCEYVVMQSHLQQHGTMSHKGNCRFCKERDSIKWEKRKKELEALAVKLKE